LRYVKGTIAFGLLYGESKAHHLIGYTNYTWEGPMDDSESTTSYVFNLGTCIVSWCSQKQHVVWPSSIKVEHKEVVKGACEVVCLEQIFVDFMLEQTNPIAVLLFVNCHGYSTGIVSHNGSYNILKSETTQTYFPLIPD